MSAFLAFTKTPKKRGFSMFTGIIKKTGIVTKTSSSKITVRASYSTLHRLGMGESVAVDGACLTVVWKGKNSFTADIMPETARKTTLGKLLRGGTVNLELPATPSSLLSGHVVQGHVDGVGTLDKIFLRGGGRVLSIKTPRVLSRYITPKGSVAVNGVSLTVIRAEASVFTVGIIPHTWKTTSLRFLSRGDEVNVEVDALAKYVEQLMRKRRV